MERSNEKRLSSMVRVVEGALKGLEGRVMNKEADEVMIAVSNSPGVYVVLGSRWVEPLTSPTADMWR